MMRDILVKQPLQVILAVTLAVSCCSGFATCTEDREPGAFCSHPTWSPDGTRIAYALDSPDTGFQLDNHIWIIDLKTGHQTQVTSRGELDTQWDPAWSPDGGRIAFVCQPAGGEEIWVAKADGTGQARLSPKPDDVETQSYWDPAWSPHGPTVAATASMYSEPAWSPDGAIIAATASRLTTTIRIVLLSADGKHKRYLTTFAPFVAESHPSWSPDGRTIAFVSDDHLWQRNADGSGLRQLTFRWARDSYVDHSPAWSPTGDKIAFVRAGLPDDPSGIIYLLDIRDGATYPLLANAPCRQTEDPAWSRDGKRVAFVAAGRNELGSEIWIADADGTGLKQITHLNDTLTPPAPDHQSR